MVTDTTALAKAIAAMRATVTAADAAIMYDKVPSTIHAEARIFGAFRNEIEAGRALLAALDGVPERIALLEAATTAATDLLEENAWGDGAFAGVWAIDEYGQGVIVNLRDALAVLAGEGPG